MTICLTICTEWLISGHGIRLEQLGRNRCVGCVCGPVYKGAASVIHRRLGKGTVTYIGTDTDDGKLEKEVVRRVYTEAGVPTEDLPYGVVKEWRDGFYIALNYTSDIQEIVIPDEAEY